MRKVVSLVLLIGAVQAQGMDEQGNLAAGLLEGMDEQGNLAAGLSFPELDISKELLPEAVGQFFNLENAGATKLGKLMAWKGDLLQPVILVGMGVFTLYTALRIILTILGGILDIKASFIGSILSLLQSMFGVLMDKIEMVQNPIVEKLSALVSPAGADSTPAAERSMRALEEVAGVVMEALTKYD